MSQKAKNYLKIGLFTLSALFVLGLMYFTLYYASTSRITQIYRSNYDQSSKIMSSIVTINDIYMENGYSSSEYTPLQADLDNLVAEITSFDPDSPPTTAINYAVGRIDGVEESVAQLQDDNPKQVVTELEGSIREFALILESVNSTLNYTFTDQTVLDFQQIVTQAQVALQDSFYLDREIIESVKKHFDALSAEINLYNSSKDKARFASQLQNLRSELLPEVDSAWANVLVANLNPFSELVSDYESLLYLLEG